MSDIVARINALIEARPPVGTIAQRNGKWFRVGLKGDWRGPYSTREEAQAAMDRARGGRGQRPQAPAPIHGNAAADAEVSARIRKDYAAYMAMPLRDLKAEYKRQFRVSDPDGADRKGLATDLVRALHGNAAADRAFGIQQPVAASVPVKPDAAIAARKAIYVLAADEFAADPAVKQMHAMLGDSTYGEYTTSSPLSRGGWITHPFDGVKHALEKRVHADRAPVDVIAAHVIPLGGGLTPESRKELAAKVLAAYTKARRKMTAQRP